MSTSDLFTADYPHGTVKGYDGLDGNEGCRGGACPGGDLWGITCKHAKQLSRSDYQYQKLAAQGLGPAEIADKLGLVPQIGETGGKPTTKRAPKPRPADHAAAKKSTKAEIAPAFAVDETVLDDPDDNLATQHDATATTILDDVAQVETELGQQAPAQPTPKEIRAWARDRGYEIKPMGKIPQLVLDHYWETHELGGADQQPVNYPQPQESAEPAPDEATITIIDQLPAGPRPEWGYVALTEDLARAQTDRDALAEELEEAKDELTRARGLAARLEEELARASEEHAAEISALHVQLSDNHNGDRQRIEQLEESLALADIASIDAARVHQEIETRLRAERDEAQRSARETRGAVALEKDDTIARLSRALEFTIRQWATERERGDDLAVLVDDYKWIEQQRRADNQRRIDKILNSVTSPATPDDDGIPPRGIRSLIRRGTATNR